ncbi:MAG: hypothetical protein U0V87_09275 [Acidobacteriota bacterium]
MAALVALISTAAGHASRVGIPALPSVYTAADELSEAPSDPLAPFRLSLGSSISALKKVASVDVQGYLRAKDDVYLHVALPSSTEAASLLPCELGIDVLDGDFFYQNGSQLMEATFLARDLRGNEHAIDALQRTFGKPDFEVVLPGALNLVIGFRTRDGFLLCTFDDLPFFRISAFRNDPQDLMAGSQMLLFEGLSDYSQRLERGESQNSLIQALMSVVTQAGMARSLLKPM